MYIYQLDHLYFGEQLEIVKANPVEKTFWIKQTKYFIFRHVKWFSFLITLHTHKLLEIFV